MSSMKVGYGRKDITPSPGIPLGGYGNTEKRLSNNVLDPLYVTCIAFEDETGTRALVFTEDLVHGGSTMNTEIRPAVSKATGIPMDFIHMSATHTHAGPDVRAGRESGVPAMQGYMDFYCEQMVKAAEEALEDLKPASLQTASVDTKGLNFVRVYLMEDGTYAGPNSGNLRQPAVAHEADADTLLQMAKITRDGCKDILLCNFGVHQTNTGEQWRGDVSADCAGALRAELEREMDCLVAYFTGACGDVTPLSIIEGEMAVPKGDHLAHGKVLAGYAMEAAKNWKDASFGIIRSAACTREYPVNHTTDHMVPQAQEIHELFLASPDRQPINKLAREKYGMSSVYHAGAILKRAKLPESLPVTISAISVGDLAFAFAPYEMYATNGIEIRTGSPYAMTMVLTSADEGLDGYMPTKLAFSHGGYASDTCKFMPGIGEELVGEFLDMLKAMKG